MKADVAMAVASTGQELRHLPLRRCIIIVFGGWRVMEGSLTVGSSDRLLQPTS